MVETVDLSCPSTDIITNIKFINPSRLITTSFDGKLSIYDTSIQTLHNSSVDSLLDTYDVDEPILSFTSLKSIGYIGTTNGCIRKIDFEQGKGGLLPFSIDDHELGVQCLNTHELRGLIISGSWDKSVILHDVRDDGKSKNILNLPPSKVYSMDTHTESDQLVISTSDKINYLYDFRNLSKPMTIFDSPFKYQTTKVKFLPNGKGTIQTSIEGKIALDFFQNPSSNYAFKSHRKNIIDESNQEQMDLVNPIYDVCFLNETRFVTCGSDSSVCMWDYVTQKRVKQLKNIGDGLAVIGMDYTTCKDGVGLLACAVSDDAFKGTKAIDEDVGCVKGKVVIKLGL
ncbi:hypothetical protein CANARDRAFT_5589 [[Candida] arabinofermentans NRRL YB-2248]|uniref:Uncharacterized protein n=1 Tax=[Candida] arabinofermentans NRRL YB-2248 TaxID=983967 RepID=A0A1E4T967_9ASCO|nr:hypothetical protein CANARDRAFT_5589 [[Candida] arabinofermentans NRRL YB-2248]